MNKTRGKSKGGLSMRFSVWLTLAAVLAALPALAEPVPLAAGGQPRATLVVEPNADPLVSGAADDLQQYVKAICGVELPRRNDGAAVDGKALYIGACASTPSGAFPPGDANPETYAITVRDGNLFLVGNHPPATSFAVYSLIQDNLGVRWFAPGPLWEFVPDGQAGELTLEVENRVVTPDWSCRVWSGHDCAPSWGQWNRRNKTICVAPVPFRNMQNFLHTVFDPAKYAETHPEYYPLIDGKRWIPSENYRNWRPCESNPEVIRITVEAAREFLDAHPEHNGFSLAMDDIYHLCGCDACRALDARPDDYENKRFSDRHYKFVNAVARELAQTHPGKYVGTLCYHIARELPETVDRLEPNVFISMTQRVGEWWRPGQRDDDIALTHAWRERCSHMSRYGYIGLGFLTPRVIPHAMAEGMKLDHSLGFEAVYNECYTILPNVAPMMYMMARLQWDTDLDPDALLDEFYARMFGEAAVTMKACYDTLERSYMEPRPDRLELARWGHRHLSPIPSRSPRRPLIRPRPSWPRLSPRPIRPRPARASRSSGRRCSTPATSSARAPGPGRWPAKRSRPPNRPRPSSTASNASSRSARNASNSGPPRSNATTSSATACAVSNSAAISWSTRSARSRRPPAPASARPSRSSTRTPPRPPRPQSRASRPAVPIPSPNRPRAGSWNSAARPRTCSKTPGSRNGPHPTPARGLVVLEQNRRRPVHPGRGTGPRRQHRRRHRPGRWGLLHAARTRHPRPEIPLLGLGVL